MLHQRLKILSQERNHLDQRGQRETRNMAEFHQIRKVLKVSETSKIKGFIIAATQDTVRFYLPIFIYIYDFEEFPSFFSCHINLEKSSLKVNLSRESQKHSSEIAFLGRNFSKQFLQKQNDKSDLREASLPEAYL